jgi:hypothetical protein
MELKAQTHNRTAQKKPHNHVETNRRVAEHTSYSLEYQSFVETPVHQTGCIHSSGFIVIQ